MDIGKACTYITEDERWMTKLGIGAGVQFLFFLIFPIFLFPGYMVQIMRNVRDGMERPLPEWDNWGELLSDGFTIFAAQIVYTIPFWGLMCVTALATGAFGATADAATGQMSDVAAAGMLGIWGITGCFFFLFAIAWVFLGPAIAIQYVREETFASCFRFGEVIAIMRENIGDIVLITVAIVAAQFVIQMAAGLIAIIPCIGWVAAFLIAIAAMPFIRMAQGHMYGQLLAKMDGGKKLDDLEFI